MQSVSANGLVLKTLDGSTITVAVDAHTRVLVDGRPASLQDVRPGFVAVVTERGKSGQAAEVDAFATSSGTPSSSKPVVGLLRSVSHNEVVLIGLDGKSLTVAIDETTHLFLDGQRASLSRIRPGFVVVVRFRPASSSDNGKKNAARPSDLFAFSRPRQASDHIYGGTLAVVTGQAVALRTQVGIVRIVVTAKTRVFVNGARGSIRRLKPGFVAVARTGGHRELWGFGSS